MKNGRYIKTDGVGIVEIEVNGGSFECIVSKDSPFWSVGHEGCIGILKEDCWELINNKPTPHKYADVIKAWADGHKVQNFQMGDWVDQDLPIFDPDLEWRIKPQNPYQDRIDEIENSISKLQTELRDLKQR